MEGWPVLPDSVEEMINRVCLEKQQDPPDAVARRKLLQVREETAIDILCRICSSNQPIRTNLSRYITWFLNNPQSPIRNGNSPTSPLRNDNYSPTAPTSPLRNGNYSPTAPTSPLRNSNYSPTAPTSPLRNSNSSPTAPTSPLWNGNSFPTPLRSGNSSPTAPTTPLRNETRDTEVESPKSGFSHQATVFSRELDYRREFLIYNYLGGNTLEEVVSDEDADQILEMKDKTMESFESCIWNAYGRRFCPPEDRRQGVDWESRKTFLYYCEVSQDGCRFKGPGVSTTKTHLQRTLGDDNVLIVKFIDMGKSCIERILKEGILIGLKRFHFFVFKDEGKDMKKKGTENDETPVSAAVKCYFVRLDSLPAFGNNQSYGLSRSKINDARCHFMHVHMVSSLAKYMARFSLILSKTIKLPIDLSTVVIERIEDIPCQDDNGCVIRDEAGEVLILTDGTGFISEDLAMKCPQNFFTAKYMNERDFEKIHHSQQLVDGPYEEGKVGVLNREPPLLMQCRLFIKGCAVKGTLLVNRKIGAGKIQIRPSMVKVERDNKCSIAPTFDSLEIVAISHKPRRCQLSKNLIALLSYGGVPRSFFMDLLTRALEETQTVFSDCHAALKVAIRNGDRDDNVTAARMISAGIPLHEPYLQDRLVYLAHSERKGLGAGKLPISESFYLMGTTDPTGLLNSNQVCIILENGQISGKVLVYRNPGLHFGDIHILEAVYVKELENFVGNAKFGIFFSTKGQRSAATEMANGDFDGDFYWVSRNPQLLTYFKPSKPWTREHSTPSTPSKKPMELSAEELEDELFQIFLDNLKPSFNMAIAANSWMSFMDRLLVLGDNNANETGELMKKILKLIDLYYDALDAPKSGKKVNIPWNLKAEKYPHYMRRSNSYNSTSVLGDIFDKSEQFQVESQPKGEIWKLPCFNTEIPAACMELGRKRYEEYRCEMQEAMKIKDGSLKNSTANGVIDKYKQLLYEAAELRESPRNMSDIYNDAIALYHATYDHALHTGSTSRCGFVWRVAGSALCRYHAIQSSANEDPILMLPSVLLKTLS